MSFATSVYNVCVPNKNFKTNPLKMYGPRSNRPNVRPSN